MVTIAHEDRVELEKWIMRELDKINTEYDNSKFCAYILTLLSSSESMEENKQIFLRELHELLQDNTSNFVNSLFNALETKSYKEQSKEYRCTLPLKNLNSNSSQQQSHVSNDTNIISNVISTIKPKNTTFETDMKAYKALPQQKKQKYINFSKQLFDVPPSKPTLDGFEVYLRRCIAKNWITETMRKSYIQLKEEWVNKSQQEKDVFSIVANLIQQYFPNNIEEANGWFLFFGRVPLPPKILEEEIEEDDRIGELQKQIQKLEEQLQSSNEQLMHTRKQFESVAQANQDLLNQIETYSTNIDKLIEEKDLLVEQNTILQDQVNILKQNQFTIVLSDLKLTNQKIYDEFLNELLELQIAILNERDASKKQELITTRNQKRRQIVSCIDEMLVDVSSQLTSNLVENIIKELIDKKLEHLIPVKKELEKDIDMEQDIVAIGNEPISVLEEELKELANDLKAFDRKLKKFPNDESLIRHEQITKEEIQEVETKIKKRKEFALDKRSNPLFGFPELRVNDSNIYYIACNKKTICFDFVGAKLYKTQTRNYMKPTTHCCLLTGKII